MPFTTDPVDASEAPRPSHRRRHRSINAALDVAGVSSFLVLAAVAPAMATEKRGGGATGGACKVTGGANGGKTGTYTTDSDGKTWCEGTWGRD